MSRPQVVRDLSLAAHWLRSMEPYCTERTAEDETSPHSWCSRMFRSTTQGGYSTAVSRHPDRVLARKRSVEVEVQFASRATAIQAREGLVHARPTDAVLSSADGGQWVVPHEHFAEKYRAVPPTPEGVDGRYVSLPYSVMAVPMSGEFEVLLADGISLLRGQPGDWLVDYGDGSFGIVSEEIFRKTYDLVG